MAYLGYVAAALIATGVVIPLGLDVASLTNFVGYVGWCLLADRHGRRAVARHPDGLGRHSRGSSR